MIDPYYGLIVGSLNGATHNNICALMNLLPRQAVEHGSGNDLIVFVLANEVPQPLRDSVSQPS